MHDAYLYADISVLLEYTQSYTEHHIVTNRVLNEFNGCVVVSAFANKKLNHGINNRIRLFEIIFREISELDSDDFESREEEIEYICEEIIDFNHLNNNTPLKLDSILEDNLEHLRDKLRNEGIEDLLMELEVLDGQTDNKREKLSRKIIHRRESINGEHKRLEVYIENTVDHPIQARNLMKGGYWWRDLLDGEGFILVKHSSNPQKKNDEITDLIKNELQITTDLYSPMEIEEQIELPQ